MVHIKNSLNICERPKYLHAVYQLSAGDGAEERRRQECKSQGVSGRGKRARGWRNGGSQSASICSIFVKFPTFADMKAHS